MREDWQKLMLGDVCELQNGFAFKSKLFKETGLPVLRISSIQNGLVCDNRPVFTDPCDYKEDLSKYHVEDEDLLIAMSGATTGKVGFNRTGQIYLLNQRVGKFIPSKELNLYFLYHFLSTRVEENLRISAGSAQPNLSTKQIKDFQIPLPPLPEQERIVSILDKAFEGIDKAIAQTEQNLASARELFESYLNNIFTQKGDDWVEKRLGEVCGFIRGPFGGSLKKSCFVEEGYAVYEQQHAINNQFVNIRYFVSDEKFNEMKRFELLEGELIMSCSGTMGKIAIAPKGLKKGIINQALLKLSPNQTITSEFLSIWMQSDKFQEQLSNNTKGVAIKNVASVKVLKELSIELPSLETQNEIEELVEKNLLLTQQLQALYTQKLNDLKELKKSLLQQAFAGELTKEDAA